MKKRFVLLAAALALAVPSAAGAQAKPDFSGTWKFQSSNPKDYDGGPGGWGAPTPTIMVKQGPSEISVQGLGHGERPLVFKLDGSDTLTEAPGKSSTLVEAVVKWRTRARWEGNSLVLYTWNTALNQERDILTLKGDGQLVVTRDTESPPPNPSTATLVYIKS